MSVIPDYNNMKHICIIIIDITNNMSTEHYAQYKFHEIYIKKKFLVFLMN